MAPPEGPGPQPLTRAAFDRLYAAERDGLVRRLSQQFPQVGGEDVRDAVQVAFIKLWDHHGAEDAAGRPRETALVNEPLAWLTRVSRRRVIDAWRADRWLVHAADAEADGAADAPWDHAARAAQQPPSVTAGTPETDFDRAERLRALEWAISQLTEPQRSTLIWFHLQGLSYDEIHARWAEVKPPGYSKESLGAFLLRARKALGPLVTRYLEGGSAVPSGPRGMARGRRGGGR